VIVPDPIGSGFAESLAQPGGNATGFMQFEYTLSAKWVELLKEIAPGVTRAAILWDPAVAAGIGQFAVIQSVAPSFIGVLLPAAANDPEFQAWVSAFLQGLQQSAWIIGRNVQIDTHWATPNPAEIRRNAILPIFCV
jgi:putative tryptophan/tyrosine transport system substrate-binding protein